MLVYCNHHNQFGECTEEDFRDAESGRNPSRMLRVQFRTFTQAVPFNTVIHGECYLTISLEVRKEKPNTSYYGPFQTVEELYIQYDACMIAAHG